MKNLSTHAQCFAKTTGADGNNPVAITDFETGDINDMKWSLDGSRVYFTYGESSQNVVLVRNFR